MSDYLTGFYDGEAEGIKAGFGLGFGFGIAVGILILTLVDLLFPAHCEATPRQKVRLIVDKDYWSDTQAVEAYYRAYEHSAGHRIRLHTRRVRINTPRQELPVPALQAQYLTQVTQELKHKLPRWRRYQNLILTGAQRGSFDSKFFGGVANASFFAACPRTKEAVVFGSPTTKDELRADNIVAMALAHERAHLNGAKHVSTESVMNISAIGIMLQQYRAGNESFILSWDLQTKREIGRCL